MIDVLHLFRSREDVYRWLHDAAQVHTGPISFSQGRVLTRGGTEAHFAHSAQRLPDLNALRGRRFDQIIFEGGTPTPEVRSFMEAHCMKHRSYA